MKIAVIGIGAFGKNHVRVLKELGHEVITVDTSVPAHIDNYTLLNHHGYNIDAAIVATPASTHYEICKHLLENKIPTLVEKPMTMDYNQALELVDIATDNNTVFAVGHIFRFHPLTMSVISELSRCLEYDRAKIFSIKSIRSGLHSPRSDCGVLWDFAIHDVDLINFILQGIFGAVRGHSNLYLQQFPNTNGVQKEHKIYCSKAFPLGTSYEDIASISYFIEYTDCDFLLQDSIYTQIDVDWISPVKNRTMTFILDKETIEADYVKEELRIHKSGINLPCERDYGEAKFNIKMGDTIIPMIGHQEPLKEELKIFIRSVNEKTIPINCAISSLSAIKLVSSL